MPAFLPYVLINFQKPWRLIAPPWQLGNIITLSSLSPNKYSLPSVIYLTKAFFASEPKGTILSFFLSWQTTYSCARFTSSIFRVINSVTLIPVAYKSSNIALSLNSLGEFLDGCSNNASTWLTVKISGTFLIILGAFNPTEGLLFIISSSYK